MPKRWIKQSFETSYLPQTAMLIAKTHKNKVSKIIIEWLIILIAPNFTVSISAYIFHTSPDIQSAPTIASNTQTRVEYLNLKTSLFLFILILYNKEREKSRVFLRFFAVI